MSYLAIIERLKENRQVSRTSQPDTAAPYEIDEKSEKSPGADLAIVPRQADLVEGLGIPASSTYPGNNYAESHGGSSGPCRYDWISGYRGLRLRCVAHHKHANSTTVFGMHSSNYDTLQEMNRLGILTGDALADARRTS